MTGPGLVSPDPNAAEVVRSAVKWHLFDEAGRESHAVEVAAAVLKALAAAGFAVVQLPKPELVSEGIYKFPMGISVEWGQILEGDYGTAYATYEALDIAASLLAASLAVGGLPVGEEAAKKPWPGHCQNCQHELPHPTDTGCRNCGADDIDD